MSTTKETELFACRLGDLIAEKKAKSNRTLTQNDIADEIGIHKSALSKYANNEVEAGLNAIIKISIYFNCSVDYLLNINSVRTRCVKIQDACHTTGLSEASVHTLAEMARSKSLGDMDSDIISSLIENGHITSFVELIRNALLTNYEHALLAAPTDKFDQFIMDFNSSYYELALSKIAIEIFNATFDEMFIDLLPQLQKHVAKSTKGLKTQASLIRKQMEKIENYLQKNNEQIDIEAIQSSYTLKKCANDFANTTVIE